jgi:hypothetical protein
MTPLLLATLSSAAPPSCPAPNSYYDAIGCEGCDKAGTCCNTTSKYSFPQCHCTYTFDCSKTGGCCGAGDVCCGASCHDASSGSCHAGKWVPPPPPPSPPINPLFPPSDLRLMAWVGGDWCDPARQQYGGMKAVVQQLRENPGLFTGVMGFCGYAFAPNGTVYIKNTTRLACCNGTLDGGDLFAEVRRQGMEFQPVMYLDDPKAAATAPAPYVEAFAARAAAEGWPGFNLDWEGGATTGNLSNFLRFCGLMNGLVFRSGARTLQNSRDPLLCTAHTFVPGGRDARERPPLLVRHSMGDAAVA